MAATIEQISEDVTNESRQARVRWGTAFDNKNTINDWVTYVSIYTSRAAAMGVPKAEVVSNLRKAGGLIMSALFYAENDLLAPRHYDEQPVPLASFDIEQ